MISRIPSGMRYYIGAEARLRRSVEDTAMTVFEGWSYEEVITPTVDYYVLFEQGMGAAEAQNGFRFTDNDGGMLSLRPDITSSVARAAATMLSEVPRPLRLCYAAPVFRQQPQSHAEWRRENTQLGCELIGEAGTSGDLEVLLLAAEILTRIGLADSSVITINHVGIFNGLAGQLDLDSEARENLRRLIDSRDQVETKRALKGLSVTDTSVNAFARLSQLRGKGEVLDEARSLIANPLSNEALTSLSQIWEVIESLGLNNNFEIDLADVSSLDYYTGLSFKIYSHGVGYRVGRGGRYDSLTSNFGGAEPAIGFVLSLDALIEVIGRSSFANGNNRPGVQTVSGQKLGAKFADALQRRMRNEQIRVE